MTLNKLLADWNNQFPLDRSHRKKYNIAFNSPQHREMSQIDIYLEWLENAMFTELTNSIERDLEDQELLKKGMWLRKDELNSEEESDLFDKIKL